MAIDGFQTFELATEELEGERERKRVTEIGRAHV